VARDRLHPLYEEARLADTTLERRVELNAEMESLARTVVVPVNVRDWVP